MNRSLGRIALLSTLALALAGCGGGSSATSDAGGSDAGADATAHDASGADASMNDAATVDGAIADGSTTGDAATPDAGTPPRIFGGARPARLVVPSSYDAATPMPLVVLLHGYGASAIIQDGYFNLSRAARDRGFLLLLPDGTIDSTGKRYWNATPTCCAFAGTDVDDVAYLRSLITDVKAAYNVDAGRVYLIGHSNGGFMSYRMACDAGDQITAIISLAGADYVSESACTPSVGVSVLQIQGTADLTVAYGPSAIGPGAVTSVERWATRDGCDATMPSSGAAIDLDTVLAGAETDVRTYPVGCEPGLSAELWTINGGSHIPSVPTTIGGTLYDWLSTHSR